MISKLISTTKTLVEYDYVLLLIRQDIPAQERIKSFLRSFQLELIWLKTGTLTLHWPKLAEWWFYCQVGGIYWHEGVFNP